VAHNLLVTEFYQQGQVLRRVQPMLEKFQSLVSGA